MDVWNYIAIGQVECDTNNKGQNKKGQTRNQGYFSQN